MRYAGHVSSEKSAYICLLWLLLGVAAFSLSCGSRENSTVQPLRFSSSPPINATEGQSYSYSVELDVSPGDSVQLSLSQAPDGASLNGKVLSWTPSVGQSRIGNSFSVVALSASGSSAVQSWIVFPRGTIRGSYIDTLWSSDGAVASAHDLSSSGCAWCSFAALVPTSDGIVVELPGTGDAGGRFQIPNVPAGRYWLRVSSQPPQLFWTESSTFDLGRDLIGKRRGAVETNINLHLDGLDDWLQDDRLILDAPDVGLSYPLKSSPSLGASTLVASEAAQLPKIEASGSSDRVGSFVLQYHSLEPKSLGTLLGASLYLPSFVVTEASSADIVGTMAWSHHQMELEIQGSKWEALFQGAGPTVPEPYLFVADVSVQPFQVDRVAAPTILAARFGPDPTDIDSDRKYGPVDYNDPFPMEWIRVFSATQTALVRVPIPGSSANVPFPVSAGYSDIGIPVMPVVPVLGTVRAPLVNKRTFYDANTFDNNSEIVLEWSAPTGLAAIGFVIQIYQLVPSNGLQFYQGPIATLYTDEMGLTLPAGIVSGGNTYIFRIQARADALANITRSPSRSRYPVAYADVISGPTSLR